jgi:amino acid transporter
MSQNRQATLDPEALGTAGVLFQSMSAVGPAASVVTLLVLVTVYAGGASPLAILVAAAVVTVLGICLGQLGRVLPSAGGIYAFVSAALGKRAGFVVAWILGFTETFNVPVAVLALVYIVQDNLEAHLGTPSWIWIPVAIVGCTLVSLLTFRGVKFSIRVMTIIGVAEFAILLALAITLIVHAGSANTLSVFNPREGNVHGLGSVFVGVIYGITGFLGFDAALPLAEESRNPRRAVPRAVVLSPIIIGVIYTIVLYAADVYWHPGSVALGKSPFAGFNGGDPFDGIAARVWGAIWVVFLLAAISSLFSGSAGATNAASRVNFALGRVRLLPAAMANVNPRHRTPSVAIGIQALITTAVMLILGGLMHGPTDAFVFLATLIVLLFLILWALASLSCLVYYVRKRRDLLNVPLHIVAPVIAVCMSVVVLIASLGINFAGLGIAPLTGASRWTPYIAAAWIALGVALCPVAMRRWPERLAQLDRVFTSAHAADAPDGPEPGAATSGTRPASDSA